MIILMIKLIIVIFVVTVKLHGFEPRLPLLEIR